MRYAIGMSSHTSLKNHLLSVFRDHLGIRREIPVSKASRVFTGPEVRGCRPVLVAFESFKDRETVLRQAKLLKSRAGIDVTEDLSRLDLMLVHKKHKK